MAQDYHLGITEFFLIVLHQSFILNHLSPGCFQYAEGFPAGPAASGGPAVPGGSGKHPCHHPGCPGIQCVSLHVPCCSTDEGNLSV